VPVIKGGVKNPACAEENHGAKVCSKATTGGEKATKYAKTTESEKELVGGFLDLGVADAPKLWRRSAVKNYLFAFSAADQHKDYNDSNDNDYQNFALAKKHTQHCSFVSFYNRRQNL